MANIPILTLITLSPLLGILILLFTPANKNRLIKTIGIATTFIPFILVIWMFLAYDYSEKGVAFEENLRWIHMPLNTEAYQGQVSSYFIQFNYHLAMDGISLLLVLLTAIVGVMAAFASVHIKKRWKMYFILFLLLEVGMFGVFMARDLFLFFLFFEVTLVATYFLIGIWGYVGREKAANKFLIYNGLGSALMLIAFTLLIATAGFQVDQSVAGQTHLSYSGDLATILQNLIQPSESSVVLSAGMQKTIFILLLVAFGIKLPIFPFHTWMLKVHNEAPPAVVMIHSGVLLKMGAYGLIRFGLFLFPQQTESWATVLAILGVINIIYGAVLALVQKEFKLVLAYSSISHMGVVLLGLSALNEIGLKGAMFQMISHGLISALFFLLVGSLYERTHTTRLDELGGLARSMPFMSGILLIAGLASLGLPGLSGFVGEFLSFLGLFSEMKVIAVVGTLGIILGAVYVLRGVLGITYGPMEDRYIGIRDARLIEAIPMMALTAFIVLLGVYPTIIIDPLQHSFEQFLQLIKVGG
jgi:NADH-quinone oxidoreductase subunit M